MTALLLNDATLIDGTGADPRPHTSVLVEDGRIARVGAAGAIDRAGRRAHDRLRGPDADAGADGRARALRADGARAIRIRRRATSATC